MATDDQGKTYSKTIMDAATNIPAIKAMVVAKKAVGKVAEKLQDMLDNDKIVPKKKPKPDIKPKLKLKPPRDERAKKNPFRLSSNRQPGIETANTKKPLRSRREMKGLPPLATGIQKPQPVAMAKGGEVKKNKSNMITKRGWGASRKT